MHLTLVNQFSQMVDGSCRGGVLKQPQPFSSLGVHNCGQPRIHPVACPDIVMFSVVVNVVTLLV